MLKKCAEIWDEVRREKPLIHCMTNYVTMNDVANIILASGASPAMVDYPDEAGGFACIAQAIYLNLGTLTGEKELAMLEAVKAAADKGIPIIVDPVACGVIPRKAGILKKLLNSGQITGIKGNSAEIKSLAGFDSNAKGVDSLDSGEGVEQACRIVAEKENAVAAATGEIDVVVYQNNVAKVKNGTSLFGSITGAGCMAGGVVAACMGAAPREPWLATITGLCAFNIAGERSIKVSGENPGTFRVLIFDNLFHLRGEDILREARVEISQL